MLKWNMLNYIRLTFILFIAGVSATIAARRWVRRGQRDHWYDYEERREWLVIFSNIHFLYVLVWKWFGFIFSTALYKHDENGETTFFVFFCLGGAGAVEVRTAVYRPNQCLLYKCYNELLYYTLSVRRFDLILPIYNRVSEVACWYEECGGMRYIRTVGCSYIIVWYMLIYVVSHEAGGRPYLPLLVYTRTRSCGHSFITHMLCVWLNSISLCLPHVLMSLWNPDRPKAFLQWNVYDWIYSMLLLR